MDSLEAADLGFERLILGENGCQIHGQKVCRNVRVGAIPAMECTHLPKGSRPGSSPLADALAGDRFEAAHRQVDAFEHQGLIGVRQLMSRGNAKASALQALIR